MTPVLPNPALRSAAAIGLCSLIGLGLVSAVDSLTAARIAANERQALLAALNELIPPDTYDNDLLSDSVDAIDVRLGTTKPVPFHRARKAGSVVAVAFPTITPEGYSGEISLLVAVRVDGTLAGVRVLSHKETPGLGDWIELEKSDWILGFNGRSLWNPTEPGWTVKKDGGQFDQFSGATITPRAVIAAVRNALEYARDHKQDLFTALDDRMSEQGAANPHCSARWDDVRSLEGL